MNNLKIHIYGLGLIGGSLAKAFKSANQDIFISAFDKAEVISSALDEKVIDEKINSIEDSSVADFIFICFPADLSLSYLENLAPVIKQNSIISDVCGLKQVFDEKWNSLQSKGEYAGGHPMTGKEEGGYKNSDPLLFENAVYILADKKISSPLYPQLIELIKTTGARIKFLSPALHDKIIAFVSHLPQLLAVTLVNSIPDDSFLDFAAGGFRDMTRIASSKFEIWEPILRLNEKSISIAMEEFENHLKNIRSSYAKGEYFESARKRRDEIPKNTKGFISSLYDLYVFVKDEPGVLSRITTAAFEAGINIKDIELLKIREGTGGTFRLSFASLEVRDRAKNIFIELGFSVVTK